jgi:two-component system phosphate regulon sensor histidine kinase PhoR
LSAALFTVFFDKFRDYYRDMLVDSLRKESSLLLLTVGPLYAQNKFAEIDALFKKISPAVATRMTLIDPSGTVLADSEKDPETMENHKTRPEIMRAMYGQVGESVRYSATVMQDMLYVAVPVQQSSAITGVLRLSLFMHDIERIYGSFRNATLVIAACITCVALLLAYIVSRRITGPVRMLREAAGSIASGNFDVRVFLKNTDELRDLADSFNFMTEKNRELFNEISLQREELKNIISSMHEYLLVIDNEGRVALCNESFRKFVTPAEVEGRLYWEIIREPEFGEMIRKVRLKRTDCIDEISFDGRILLSSMSWIEQNEKIVVVFLDITEIKNVERIKKDFVVNVSHELRTPLTAIKGFIETMHDEISEQTHRRYLEIIKRHTDRLINIVKDLLTLSNIEEEQQLELEHVNLKTLLEQLQKIYDHRFNEKKLSFVIDLDENLMQIKADPFKIEQVFINLIDNALKYTESGSVTLKARNDGDHVLLCVEDTGIGIRSEHQPRIFERFYVVDKARSRQAGGTGLGLSIVKHIVLLHKGTIEVQSTVGRGTRFLLRLPLDPAAV